jgi:protein-L-isoaspartate(D-aspartate) O-methyltransferase
MESSEIFRNLNRLRVDDPRVLAAIRKVPRERFVPEEIRLLSERDRPLPIGQQQTISQPSLVGLMTLQLNLTASSKVLEIGTGSGYQTAILAELSGQVFSVEVRRNLSEKAQELLQQLGYKNIHFKIGDGSWGWEEEAPFDAIIVTAVSYEWPTALVRQLKDGGRLVVPIREEEENQGLYVVTKKQNHWEKERILAVSFVPLVTGESSLYEE